MSQLITQGVTMKVTPKAPLKFYYVKLPVVDLSLRILGRFGGPIDTIFVEYRIATIFSENSSEDLIETRALEIWNDMVEAAAENAMALQNEEISWLYEYESVELIECEITPKGA